MPLLEDMNTAHLVPVIPATTTSRERFRDGMCNVRLSSENFRDISRLAFRRAEIDDGGSPMTQSLNNLSAKTARAETCKFHIKNELGQLMSNRRLVEDTAQVAHHRVLKSDDARG